MKFHSINPYNNEVLGSFDTLSKPETLSLLTNSQKAFEAWKETEFTHRGDCLRKAAKILREKKEPFARTMTLEMGKPISEALGEIEKCAWVCEYYADHGAGFLKDKSVQSDADVSLVKYQPLGIILAIMPWNFPFWQVFRFAAPALMAGNGALLKHAPNVLGCARHIEDIFSQAGFPPHIFQNVIIDIDQVKDLIENDIIKAVTLTGSERAGSSVGALAGKNIKKSVLELGGSNAFVVLKDADLEQSVAVGMQARMLNTGQSCIAAKRFIVEQEIADEFTERMKEKIAGLRMGDPLDDTTQIGPLARIDLAEQLEGQVRKSEQLGAKLVIGGERKEARYTPALLTGVRPGMPAFDEELFGPVAPIIVAHSMDEALALANRSRYGLGASVFTKDKEKAQVFIDKMQDGAVFINALVKSDPRLPFGGTKYSGYGRELSEEGIKEFVNIKTVYIQGV